MAAQAKLAVLVFAAFLVVDFVWIGLLAQGFYVREFGPVGRTEGGRFQVVYWAALGVYVLLTAGLLTFVLPRIGVGEAWYVAFAWGAGFGLLLYGVYDLTNHATLRHWPLRLLAFDMAWGTLLNGIVALIAQTARDRWL